MAVVGARFESYVRAAMAEADDLPTMAELYRQSGIVASTWSGWFRGISTPRRNSMVLAGRALNRTPEQLLAAWDGERPQKRRTATETPDTLVAALRDQTTAISALVALLAAADLPARVAALEPVVSRLAERVLAEPPEQPIRQETTG